MTRPNVWTARREDLFHVDMGGHLVPRIDWVDSWLWGLYE